MALLTMPVLRAFRHCISSYHSIKSNCTGSPRYSIIARWYMFRGLTSVARSKQFTIMPPRCSSKVNLKPPKVDGNRIFVFSDVNNTYVQLSNTWLRDHCRCSECFHEVTKQRLIETFDEIPTSISIIEAGIRESVDDITVFWNDEHQSHYNKEWLVKSSLKQDSRSLERLAVTTMELWDGESIKEKLPTIDYEVVMSSEDGVKHWLTKIRKFGFSFVNNCPVTPEASEKLLKRISFIRSTHYGGFYDFTADLSSHDTAYTQLGIGAHTDNTFLSDPAGLQMLHLLSHTNGSGGASQLVDGFGAAAELLQEDPEAYYILATWRVHCHANSTDDINGSIQPYQPFPVLCHDAQDKFLVQIRWNTAHRAAIDAPIEEMDKWYDAARKWAAILRKREYWEQLQPGRPLIFDNWRVLHGRSAFTGHRRVCGGYINRDDWISRFKLLNRGQDAVHKDIYRG